MLVTITTLSTWTGQHRDTIRKRLGPILTGQHGEQVDSVKALPLIYGGSEKLDPAQERAALDKVKRGLAMLEFKQKEKALIPIEVVFKVIDAATLATREALMGIPGRFAAILAAETDEREIERLLDGEIRQALTNLVNAKRAELGQR